MEVSKAGQKKVGMPWYNTYTPILTSVIGFIYFLGYWVKILTREKDISYSSYLNFLVLMFSVVAIVVSIHALKRMSRLGNNRGKEITIVALTSGIIITILMVLHFVFFFS